MCASDLQYGFCSIIVRGQLPIGKGPHCSDAIQLRCPKIQIIHSVTMAGPKKTFPAHRARSDPGEWTIGGRAIRIVSISYKVFMSIVPEGIASRLNLLAGRIWDASGFESTRRRHGSSSFYD